MYQGLRIGPNQYLVRTTRAVLPPLFTRLLNKNRSAFCFFGLCAPSLFRPTTPHSTSPNADPTQPVVGVMSDHREGQGQRSFFLAAGTIIMAASLALLPAAGSVCRRLAGGRYAGVDGGF